MQSHIPFQKESTKLSNNDNHDFNTQMFGKRGWNNKATDDVDTGPTPSPTWSSLRHSKFPTALAYNASWLKCTWTETSSSSSTLMSLRTSVCKVIYQPTHATAGCPLLQWEVIQNTTTIRKKHIRRKNGYDRFQRPPSSNIIFRNNLLFNSNRQPSSSIGRTFTVSQFVRSLSTPLKQ